MEIIDSIYKNRKDFILIGLTGRIGSGCTTAADFLSKSIKDHNLREIIIDDSSNDSHRKRYIIDKFYRKNWAPFTVITMSDIITMFIVQHSYSELRNIIEDFNSYIENRDNRRFYSFNKIELTIKEEKYNELHNKYKNIIDDLKKEKIYSRDYKSLYDLLMSFFKDSKIIKEELSRNTYKNYTDLYQLCGDNLRLLGSIKIQDSPNVNNIYTIAEKVNLIIKLIKRYNEENNRETYIVIDAIRNVLEAYFFRERYSAFYLIAINADNDDIKSRLRERFPSLSEEDIEKQLKKEDIELKLETIEDFASQNIQSCIVNADIYIYNKGKSNDDKKELFGQLIKFVSLIKHPGLITPSHDEKMMQIAFTAKLNSACLSRQVGACVTNKYGSVKAIGWNSVAEGQTPCLLRGVKDLLQELNSKSYSAYEKSKEFKNKLKDIYKNIDQLNECGLNDSFCFKSIYTKDNPDELKNQVHTRALHAEENAFLQLSKYGSGEAIIEGTLYSTASPCELCSKKAYQLGIKRIVYIDPYPGIAKEQILQSGLTPPVIELFSGAIGVAYYKLYSQIIPYKDELNTLQNG